MNINHSYGQTSFGKAYLDPEGVEKFCKDRFKGSFTNDLIEAASQYEKEQEKIRLENTEKNINFLKSLSD